MNRRSFLRAAAALSSSRLLEAAPPAESIGLNESAIVTSNAPTARERKAVMVLVEEAEKRSGIRWSVEAAPETPGNTAIYAGTAASWKDLGPRVAMVARAASLAREGYTIRHGSDAQGHWIAVLGADERGLLFGIGKLLQCIAFGKQQVSVDARRLNVSARPRYPLRGHQLGYRPKTNSYDAWSVPVWDQYMRDLALFGTNAVELVPPRTDDEPDSPHFPLPPDRMMAEMSGIADSYGMDVWIWYPAMDKDYSDPKTVDSALEEWARVFERLPRIDAVFVPGGDPGHTPPQYLLALLEKQKTNLRRFHPKARMWISPQSFAQPWMEQFFDIVARKETQGWLDGVVYGPQSRVSLPELRKRLPSAYPIRFYPDITHSVECQFSVPEWDVAFALTEGREVINPRPSAQANILRRFSPDTVGFITYSEGCNDDVNKFVWSALGWDPDRSVHDVLRDFSRYFLGEPWAEGFAQGLSSLEENWRGPLGVNDGVETTLLRFQDMERSAPPALLENWRFQQGLYRAYYDAAVRSRLIDETARLRQALDLLASVSEIGWTGQPLDISEQPSPKPPNGLEPQPILERAGQILAEAVVEPRGRHLSARVRELGEALFQSIRMQLAVQRYRGEAVSRGANLETLDYPVSDVAWLRKEIALIGKLPDANKQIQAMRDLVSRTDPGPGGFYDELGNPGNRPHLVAGPGSVEDPEFRASALTGFDYPDEQGDRAPIAWKRWAEALFDAPLRMHYTELNREARYRLRVVYSGDSPSRKIRLVALVASAEIEIHPLLKRPWPPKPIEFDLPAEATSTGELNLQWTREPGLGGNGRGCQVSEVWLIQAQSA
jgi:hypothetical protein